VKLRVQGRELYNALQKIKSAVGRRASLPMLRCVRLEAKDGKLCISATDLAIAATLSIPAEGELSPVLVEHVGLSRILKGLRCEIGIEPKEGGVTIETPDWTVTLACNSPVEEWPALPLPSGEFHEIPDLLAKLRYVEPAMCVVEDHRARLCGVRMEPGRLVATDTHRLHFVESLQGEDWITCTVPADAISFLPRLFKGIDPIEVSQNGTNIWFRGGDGISLASRLLEGQYPDYRKMLASHTPTQSLACDVPTLSERLNAVLQLGLHHLVCCVAEDQSLVLSAADQVCGYSIETRLPVAVTTGWQGFEWAMDTRYFVDALRPFRACRQIDVRGIDAERPFTITSDELPGVTTVVMARRSGTND